MSIFQTKHSYIQIHYIGQSNIHQFPMQGDKKNLIQYNQLIFQQCYKNVEQVMKGERRISIVNQDQYIRSSSLYSMINPIIRIDLNSLILTVMDKQHQIQQIQISNCSSIQFCLDMKILEKTSQRYSNIKAIDLYRCNIGDKGITILLLKTSFDCLQKLGLRQAKLTKKGVKLLGCCRLKSLKYLNLRCNKIGNAGLCYLVKADWPKISNLSIQDCNLTVDAVRVISKASWPTISQIYFKGNLSDSLRSQSFKWFVKKYYPSTFKIDKYERYWKLGKIYLMCQSYSYILCV